MLGVDSSGIYQFEDVNKDAALTSLDYRALGNRDPKFYGGFQNSMTYRNWQFQFFLDFRKQSGRNYFGDLVRFLPTSIPGFYTNQISDVLNRWQKPGDITTIEKFTSQFGTPAMKAYANLAASDGIYTDASFIRLKNISLRYLLNAKTLKTLRISAANIFINAENVLTITKFEGADPETQSFYSLPPLRTIVFGIQLTL
jgi:TonB-dependent starch-binding outer membrane protein SusC